jgi:hypothetical protein
MDMTMVTGRDYAAQREYYKDQMRAAKRYRLTRVTSAGRDKSSHLYCKALAWLGRRLIAWGSSLQEQYDTVVSAPMRQSANQAVGR